MAISVKFYTLSKAINSTKLPGTAALDAACTIKEMSSTASPVLLIQHSNPAAFNYCYIDSFSRYYYVSEWISVANNLWEAHCTVDALATYRSNIIGSSQYVLRSSITQDGNIIDAEYPESASIQRYTESVTGPFQQYQISGRYILGVIGQQSSTSAAGIYYYVLDAAAFSRFMNALFGDDDYYGIHEISFQLTKAIFNPSDYITTCRFLPFTPTAGADQQMHFGYWESSAYGGLLQQKVYSWSGDIDIPKHPAAATRGVYLNVSAARYTLFAPCFGTIPLNPQSLKNATTLHLGIYVDCVTGNGLLLVSANNILIERVSGKVAAEIPVGQVSQDFLGAGMSAAGAATSMAGGNVVGSLAGIASALASAVPQVRVSGTQGSMSEFMWSFTLTAEFNDIASDGNDRKGRAVCSMLTINSGYYECQNPKVEISGSDEEMRSINEAMEGGFYAE